MNSLYKTIFKNGSKTYYYSSFFFPPAVKEDVFKLYSFVRTADDYVDIIPQKKQEFYEFRKLFESSLEGEETGNLVIDGFSEVMRRREFEPGWVEAFLNSMESDLYINSYETIESLMKYLYGSAEVVGLMMEKYWTYQKIPMITPDILVEQCSTSTSYGTSMKIYGWVETIFPEKISRIMALKVSH